MSEAWITLEFESLQEACAWLRVARCDVVDQVVLSGNPAALSDEPFVVARVVGGLDNALRAFTEMTNEEAEEPK